MVLYLVRTYGSHFSNKLGTKILNINCAVEQTLQNSLIPLFFWTPCRWIGNGRIHKREGHRSSEIMNVVPSTVTCITTLIKNMNDGALYIAPWCLYALSSLAVHCTFYIPKQKFKTVQAENAYFSENIFILKTF